MNPLCDLLGISHPLLQAPMAGAAHGRLAAAVSAAGGLGMVGVHAGADASWLAAQADEARAAGPFGIGLLLWRLADDDAMLDAALRTRPTLLALSFGDPTPYVSRVHAAGALLAVQVQDAAGAVQALEAGADVLVAQGTEAGGHTGGVATLPLLQQVLPLGERAAVPVVAAGGIATGRALAGVLTMGAHGVWVGTRFAATREGALSDGAKRRIVAADATDTVLTHVFDLVQEAPWPDPFPGRALRNRTTERWHGREDELASRLPQVQATFRAALERDDRDVAHVYAGQASGVVDDLPSAGAVVADLVDEARRWLARATTLAGDLDGDDRGVNP
ncbi:NAD(P)H-dependent flavin oxidoreductase [Egicoccus sp. AB-alg2]|uniref:NAD(P)H-dependent flavin oxidoreductase n=1 Tax=Egicoccus sp. AB-alg2 TaxID=3242693 RepID=UPI00359DBA41